MDYSELRRVPNALREARNRKGLSQKEVARRLGLKDRAWISRWESGYILPSLVNAARLSLLYEEPIEELFPGLMQALAGRGRGANSAEVQNQSMG